MYLKCFLAFLRDGPIEITHLSAEFFFLRHKLCTIFFFSHISYFVTNREKHGINVIFAQMTRKNNTEGLEEETRRE